MRERRRIVYPPGSGTFIEGIGGTAYLSPRVFSLLTETRPPSDEHRALLQVFLEHLPRLRGMALLAREKAVSWRDFRVGNAVLAASPPEGSGLPELGEYSGANMKASEHSRTVCAEAQGVGAARSAGYTHIVGIVVAGVPQEDSQSGLVTPTLEPCGECRALFSNLPEIGMNTLIATFHAETSVWELQYFQELLAKHEYRPKER